jgi:hypothetical protein
MGNGIWRGGGDAAANKASAHAVICKIGDISRVLRYTSSQQLTSACETSFLFLSGWIAMHLSIELINQASTLR